MVPVSYSFRSRITPLSLFHTELLNLTGPKIARTQSTNKCLIDPEDCFGAVYLTEFGLPVSVFFGVNPSINYLLIAARHEGTE